MPHILVFFQFVRGQPDAFQKLGFILFSSSPCYDCDLALAGESRELEDFVVAIFSWYYSLPPYAQWIITALSALLGIFAVGLFAFIMIVFNGEMGDSEPKNFREFLVGVFMLGMVTTLGIGLAHYLFHLAIK